MKIIIKGDRNVGKSCLLERLQGKGFVESYTPTEEIQVASIQWSFKATEDIVKVEVWDVVDRGKARQRNSGLKLSMGGIGSPEQPALDAEFLDVYKGTHGVVLMLDVTKAWTFEYVIKEISKVPTEIPILIFGNHCDMGHHRVVTAGQVDGLIEGLNRTGEVIYGESSMRNGFGLRLLHKFLGLPFLKLQKESLLALIERNKRDTQICSFEVSEFLKSDDSDYNKFLDNLSNKRRQVADSNPKALSHSPSNTSINSNSSGIPSEFRPTKSIIVGGGQPIVIPGQLNITNDPKFRAQQTLPNKNSTSSSSGLISNLLGRIEIKDAIPDTINYSVAESKCISVEEFCPEGGSGLDRSFLDDLPSVLNSQQNLEVIDSDSDNEGGNPMVASFHEEPEEEMEQIIHSRAEEIKPKINPLAKNSKAKTERKQSFTSSGEDIPIVTNNKIDDINEISSEDLDSWLADSNVRRSPEGGEDLSLNQRIQQEPAVEIVVSEEKLEKKKKKKKEKKEKRDKDEKSSKEKKKKKKSKENDLEDFLNGSSNSENHVAEEYDSI